MGTVYKKLADYDNAIKYLFESLKIYKTSADPHAVFSKAYIMQHLGQTFLEINAFDEAEEYLLQS